MNTKKLKIFGAVCLVAGLTACTDLDEKVYSQIGPEQFYQNESSVKGAVASIYNDAAQSYSEKFYFLQELSADQLAWRCWNGGLWGYDDGEKYVLSTHTWSATSVIIKQAWSEAWTTIGLCNDLLRDMSTIGNVAGDKTDAYKSEIRTLRAWAYYNVYEIWGPAIPLYTESDMNTASADYGISFEEGQKKVFDFLVKELDESLDALPVESGGGETHTVMNQALNRLLMARVFLNANVLFAVGDHFTECEQICDDILAGHYGKYSLETDWRKLYDLGNEKSPEIIFAFAHRTDRGPTSA